MKPRKIKAPRRNITTIADKKIGSDCESHLVGRLNQLQLRNDFRVQFNPDRTGTLNGLPLSTKLPRMKFQSGESFVRSAELASSSSRQGRHPPSSDTLQRRAVTGELVSDAASRAAGTALSTRNT